MVEALRRLRPGAGVPSAADRFLPVIVLSGGSCVWEGYGGERAEGVWEE